MAKTPSIVFDDVTSKASATRNVGEATLKLVDEYNGLIDSLALLRDPAVIKHLENSETFKGAPDSIRKAIAAIHLLLAQEIEQVNTGAREAAEATLTALRTQLTEDFDQKLAEIRDLHDQERTTAKQQHEAALSGKDAQITRLTQQIGMYHRLGVYQGDVHDTINAYVRLFSAGKDLRAGIHPVGLDENMGGTIRRRFEVSGFLFTVVTARPGQLSEVRDYVIMETTKDSKLPKLVPFQLEVRKDSELPGLSDNGHQALENILRKLTHNWFREVAPKLTDIELGKVFLDPAAARHFFRDRSQDKSGISLSTFFGLGQEHDHNAEGPGSCPACNAFADVMTNGFGGAENFDYVAAGPHGSRFVFATGLSNWPGSNNREQPGYGKDFDKE